MPGKTQSTVGIVFMFVFFFLGGMANVFYHSKNIEWLRGVPQFMAALSFLSPAVFSWRIWLNRPSLSDGWYWKIPILFVYFMIIALIVYFGVTAYLN
jgi:hypothetical protein